MGFDDVTASSAIRVSMGPTTTKDEVSRFIDAWTGPISENENARGVNRV